MSESKIQQECFMWFHNSFPALRMRLFMNYNNPPNKIQGAMLKGMGLVAGVADMSLLLDGGRIAFIEFKTADGKQSPKQVEFQAVCNQLAIPYHIARSFQDFQTIIKTYYNGL